MGIKKTTIPLALLCLTPLFLVSCNQQENSFTDKRDGKVYKTVKIGNQTWMAENLNYNTRGFWRKLWENRLTDKDSWCYRGYAPNCKKYGRLYDFSAAITACPDGWHLPNKEEWKSLIDAAGGGASGGDDGYYRHHGVAVKRLKSKEGWRYDDEYGDGNGTDDFGFSALPGGSGGNCLFGDCFRDAGVEGNWWSSTHLENGNVSIWRIDNRDVVSIENGGGGASVRCVLGLHSPPIYRLTVNAGQTRGGTVSPYRPSMVAGGMPLDISAAASSGYTFQRWAVARGTASIADPCSAVTTVTIGSDATVTASFKQHGRVTGEPFVDLRGGGRQTYNTVRIGKQVWMAENMNYKTREDSSWCYDSADSACAKYGRLYNWGAAEDACPNGWRLPGTKDWDDLLAAVGSPAGTRLKAAIGWDSLGEGVNIRLGGTDDFGFSALPGGYRDHSDGIFYYAGYNGHWWSATTDISVWDRHGRRRYTKREIVNAHFFSMYSGTDFVRKYSNSIGNGFSVRCIEDVDHCNPTGGVIDAPAAAGKRKSFIDYRDNKKYRTVEIGGKTWMAENLHYGEAEGSVNNNVLYEEPYGWQYTWETALRACPSGWHLPSRAEWDTLIQGVGGRCIAGRRLKSKTGWGGEWDDEDKWGKGTDDYGFSLLPGGVRSGQSVEYRGIDHYGRYGRSRGYFWSATEHENNRRAYSRMVLNGSHELYENVYDKGASLSVRCVRD